MRVRWFDGKCEFSGIYGGKVGERGPPSPTCRLCRHAQISGFAGGIILLYQENLQQLVMLEVFN